MYHLRHQKYKIEHTEVKYLKSILKNRILKVKKTFFQNQKNIREINLRELSYSEQKDREIKKRKEIDYLFTKPVIIPAADPDKFKYDSLINYIFKPIKK